jgi:predicted TIM-barrel enzyme
MHYKREEVLRRLQAQIGAGKAIVVAGAGTGISAKFAEAGGTDLIVIYNSGRYRMSGHSSVAGLLAYGDANQIVYDMGEREVLPVVRNTPVIAGVNGTDPTRQMPHFLGRLADLGFSGVINFPTVGLIDGRIRAELEQTGLGFGREVEMIRTAHRMAFFTMVYVFTPAEAREMAEAGADVIVAHLGTTVGGTTGIGQGEAMALQAAPACVTAIAAAARGAKPDVLVLCHGGPIATPDDARYVLEHTDAVGFVGASSMERLPVEKAISETTRRFKEIPIRSA